MYPLYEEKEENLSKTTFGTISCLMDNFQCADYPVMIYRNMRLLAVGKIEWLIYKGTKIWHIGNIISFSFEEIKELNYSVDEGYKIFLRD